MYCCGSVALILFVVFYFCFPNTRKSFINYWVHRIPIQKSENENTFSPLVSYIALFILGTAWVIVVGMIVYATTPVAPVNVNSAKAFMTLQDLAWGVVLEELVFRGSFLLLGFMLLKWLGKDLSYPFGIISSILFAAIHLWNFEQFTAINLLQITNQFLAGLILWWLAKRYSIFSSVIYHFGWNLVWMTVGGALKF